MHKKEKTTKLQIQIISQKNDGVKIVLLLKSLFWRKPTELWTWIFSYAHRPLLHRPLCMFLGSWFCWPGCMARESTPWIVLRSFWHFYTIYERCFGSLYIVVLFWVGTHGPSIPSSGLLKASDIKWSTSNKRYSIKATTSIICWRMRDTSCVALRYFIAAWNFTTAWN